MCAARVGVLVLLLVCVCGACVCVCMCVWFLSVRFETWHFGNVDVSLKILARRVRVSIVDAATVSCLPVGRLLTFSIGSLCLLFHCSHCSTDR